MTVAEAKDKSLVHIQGFDNYPFNIACLNVKGSSAFNIPTLVDTFREG